MNLPTDFTTLIPVVKTIPSVKTKLEIKDYLGAVKVRWGIGRDHYRVAPGLYKVGRPGSQSDVFISANYKLSFDTLRKNLTSLDAWILVIDTKGVNVWCAAGKGTFGTDNIIKSIKNTSLETIVHHRRIIVPQLGATGVAAHLVKEMTGFRVIYGPVRAKDIRSFIAAGYKATAEMRKVTFPLLERAKLIPVDLIYNKYKLLFAALLLVIISGLDRSGFVFQKMAGTSIYPVTSLFGAYLSGVVIGPLLLPWIPFRAFSLKGAICGFLSAFLISLFFKVSVPENLSAGLISISVASFMTMNFTGSSTFTSLSGVKKEMSRAVPFQIIMVAAGLILLIVSKFLK